MRVEIRNLEVQLGGRKVLKDLSLDLFAEGPQVVALIGPSGSGKSTLIRVLKGLLPPTRGEVRFNGEPVYEKGRPRRALQAQVGIVFQQFQLVDRLSALENVLLGRLPYLGPARGLLRRFPPSDLERAWEVLGRVGLQEHAWQRADALSGGQKQRVGIARALAQEPRLLLADEPISALDPKNARAVLDLLLELVQERSIPLLLTLHHLEVVRAHADRVVALKEGRVVYDGPAHGLTPEVERDLYFGEGLEAGEPCPA
ncbi:phosphonates import ATP-binding protein PhnC (plasmid) [Thermus thermophilus]|uniref:phosphonate ABC transporter ATP-binding protein n=1 Tax=Thermus thermophilus TaxID=274 RepID=UPI001FCA7A1B|nr:phosphonate ABC transporter ATP-binding protein [Thermus thermophilus]BDG20185.1 phosphonates import ATP-binding protein PhnC [Thermus thermophilus]BDG22729.1 phosphonates import ATP-binding protein PhnC [Thermus thermophilus]BDG29807.1 phosphonates import ATP-binding protein PhnC [Thermus thermophilus]